MISILIVASSAAMRAGLRALLAEAELEIAGEVATLDGVELEQIPFDVLLVANEALLVDIDLVLSDESTLALVLLTDDEEAIHTLQPLPLHGWALLPVDSNTDELYAALFAASHGLVILSPSIAEQLIDSPLTPEQDDLIDPLTPRESEVLALLGQGLSNKLIARQLRISTHTVKFHISSIFSKLGASSRTDAVSRGARYGLIVL